jgi:hypothetical protein
MNDDNEEPPSPVETPRREETPTPRCEEMPTPTIGGVSSSYFKDPRAAFFLKDLEETGNQHIKESAEALRTQDGAAQAHREESGRVFATIFQAKSAVYSSELGIALPS